MNNINFLDLITILSFLVGLENLELNEQQVNNLEEHLKKQDQVLIEKQNKMMLEILDLLKEIKKLLLERGLIPLFFIFHLQRIKSNV